MYSKSKAVKSGDIVSLRGDKYIRCGGRRNAVGVYLTGERKVIRKFDNEVVAVDIPEGILIRGWCVVGTINSPSI